MSLKVKEEGAIAPLSALVTHDITRLMVHYEGSSNLHINLLFF
jgi:hypothetical protein